MLLFIKDLSHLGQRNEKVSIHHMLLFISMEADSGEWFLPGFNTSHVTLYPRFIGILSIHMSNNTPKPKEFQYFYQALLEILYF